MIVHDISAGPGLLARVVGTDRSDGDFNVKLPAAQLERVRSEIAPTPWTWLNQVHGSTVVKVSEAGEHAGRDADGAVTTTPGCVLAVHTADCAPVVIVGEGVVGIAHAGWRGIVEGVIPNTIDLVRMAGGGGPIRAYLGPCIRPGAYEFSESDLDTVTAVVGDSARGLTAEGRPALDMGAAVSAALSSAGVDEFTDTGLDTSLDRFFSHRTRGDVQRQVTVTWIEVTP